MSMPGMDVPLEFVDPAEQPATAVAAAIAAAEMVRIVFM
jgi:hypothetical protein